MPNASCRNGNGGGYIPMIVTKTYSLGVGENAQESDVASTLRVKEPYGGGEALIVMQRRFSDVLIRETETSPTLEAGGGGGEGGNNLPMILDTLVFDESQITCPTNGLHPKWGGQCHSLTGEAGRTVVIIRRSNENDLVNEQGGLPHQSGEGRHRESGSD